MRIETRLFATLRINRTQVMMVDIEEPATPRGIIEQLDIKESEVAILLINGRTGSLDRVLEEGDYLSIFPPVGGG